MTNRIDVLGIGNAIVDVQCKAQDDDLERRGLTKGSMILIDDETVESLEATFEPVSRQPGGSIANSMVWVARLGSSSQFIGKVAPDSVGVSFADGMKRFGVEFNTPVLDSSLPSGSCHIFVTPDGQRTMCTYLGAATHLGISDLDVDSIGAAQYLFVEGYLWQSPCSRELIEASASEANLRETKVALSLSDSILVESHRVEIMNFVEKSVDVLFGNELEMKVLAGKNDAEGIIATLAPKVELLVITRGNEGSIAVANEKRYNQDAIPVPIVVDTTGAGDAYAGGFLAKLCQGESVADCMLVAARCGADVVTHFGARDS